jgi:hypothetical protein
MSGRLQIYLGQGKMLAEKPSAEDMFGQAALQGLIT